MRSIGWFGRARHALLAGLGVVALCAVPSAACLWDSDTLRTEAQGLPGVAEAVTGFFDRYPDAYYERRLEIVVDRLAADPSELEAFDDAAVACDRLGRHDEAFIWLARKREVMDGLEVSSKAERAALEEHEYRYHANLGTVYAHRWVNRGANAQDTRDLELARQHIIEAIKINPDAHFGRERYQLAAIKWLLSPDALVREDADEIDLPPGAPLFLAYVPEIDRAAAGNNGWRAVEDHASSEALVGLIVLGAAWESVDVTEALAEVLVTQMHSSLGYVAWLRADELRAAGKNSLHPDLRDWGEYTEEERGYRRAPHLSVSMQAPVDEWFVEARRAADVQRAERNAWIEAKIAAGEHPDTHLAFWEGAPGYEMPRLPGGIVVLGEEVSRLLLALGVGLAVVIGLFVALPIVLVGWRNKRRALQERARRSPTA